MQLIATRHYDDFDPVTRKTFDLVDRMYRLDDGSFVLMRAGELPGDPGVEEPYSLQAVFAWLQDCPFQLERASLIGAKAR